MPMSVALPLALTLASALCLCSAFNLDVNFPIRFASDADRNTSYGTSVLLHADATGRSESWIQIGEPITRNKNGAKGPGQVFRCSLGKKCENVKFATIPGNKVFENFLGGAMASQSPNKPGTVVTCASRWHDSTPYSGTYLFTGACNWLDPATPQTNEWLTPLLDKSRSTSVARNPTVFDWAIGQAGFSAHFPWSDRAYVVLGAPGVLNWGGAVVVCGRGNLANGGKPYSQTGNRQQQREKPACIVPEMPSEAFTEFDYLGYQLTSGEFFKKGDTLLAVGAPRAGAAKKTLYGMVQVFRLPEDSSGQMKRVTFLEGFELGSYFGASLATGKFNGDEFDDLAVGAPLSAGPGPQDADVGFVYQYLGGKTNSFHLAPSSGGKIKGRVPGGRFGQAIACPGDLDKDGYADLVVGAPYENDGQGAIYVFNGGLDGLSSVFSQRILAADSLVRGFGISLSSAVDIDRNKYQDIAVGSYGAVVLLRAQPVVELTTSFRTQKDRVPQNATKVTVEVCVSFTGDDFLNEIDVILITEVRSGSGRDMVSFVNPISNQLSKNLTTMMHLEQKEVFHKFDINIKEGSKYLESILVFAYAFLNNSAANSAERQVIDGTNLKNDKFCKKCPVEKKIMERTEMKLSFANVCKNQKCTADLNINWHFLNDSTQIDTHVVGSLKPLRLVLSAENKGEPAFDTELVVVVPKSVSLASIPSNCELEVTSSNLTCKLIDLTAERNSSSVTVSLDMSKVLHVGDGTLDFVVIAKTASEQKISNNFKTARLALIRVAELSIIGKPMGRASYRYASSNVSMQQVEFAHEYTVNKIGESPLDDAVVRVRYPFGWQTKGGNLTTFLEAYRPDVLQDGQPLSCTPTEDFLDEVTNTDALDSNVRKKRATSASDKRDVVTAGDTSVKLPANETFYLHCKTAGVFCANITCNVRPLSEDSSVRITMRMKVDMAKIGGLLGGKTIVSLTTLGEVSWDGGKLFSHINATTHFIGAAEVLGVASWIIALSIAGGLLLFFFVVMGLIKAGFFQRKQKMELEALIEQEEEVKAINRQTQMLERMDDDDE